MFVLMVSKELLLSLENNEYHWQKCALIDIKRTAILLTNYVSQYIKDILCNYGECVLHFICVVAEFRQCYWYFF